MKINTNNVKLEEFNNCPGRDEIIGYLESQFTQGVHVEDAQKTYWQNADDTLVLKITMMKSDEQKALYLLPWRKNADEFDELNENGDHFVRIWWD